MSGHTKRGRSATVADNQMLCGPITLNDDYLCQHCKEPISKGTPAMLLAEDDMPDCYTHMRCSTNFVRGIGGVSWVHEERRNA